MCYCCLVRGAFTQKHFGAVCVRSQLSSISLLQRFCTEVVENRDVFLGFCWRIEVYEPLCFFAGLVLTMSANMFNVKEQQPHGANPSPPTKIPVPSSPLTLRRSISLRFRAENDVPTGRASGSLLRCSSETHRARAAPPPPPPKRGGSFVEERGGRGAAKGSRAPAAFRPTTRATITETRGQGGPQGLAAPDGNGRTRSMVSVACML